MRARLLVIVLLSAALLAPGFALARGDARQRARPAVTYTVRAGDTLWDIAGRVAPGRDPRPLVDQLISDNHLHGDLQVGQAITIPAPSR